MNQRKSELTLMHLRSRPLLSILNHLHFNKNSHCNCFVFTNNQPVNLILNEAEVGLGTNMKKYSNFPGQLRVLLDYSFDPFPHNEKSKLKHWLNLRKLNWKQMETQDRITKLLYYGYGNSELVTVTFIIV